MRRLWREVLSALKLLTRAVLNLNPPSKRYTQAMCWHHDLNSGNSMVVGELVDLGRTKRYHCLICEKVWMLSEIEHAWSYEWWFDKTSAYEHSIEYRRVAAEIVMRARAWRKWHREFLESLVPEDREQMLVRPVISQLIGAVDELEQLKLQHEESMRYDNETDP